jgi:lipopolysaccharide export LptBFGC system permease protein LptF
MDTNTNSNTISSKQLPRVYTKKSARKTKPKYRISFFHSNNNGFKNMNDRYELNCKKLENYYELRNHLEGKIEELQEKNNNLSSLLIEANRENFILCEKNEKLTCKVLDLNTSNEYFENELKKRSSYEIHLWSKISNLTEENERLKNQIDICSTALTN